MSPSLPIRRALISVYDKTGVVDFARALHHDFGIEIISTGGTARILKEAGIPVTMVEQVTGFAEMMDGRVKTLHPRIHAAILADRDNPEHMRQLAEQGIEPIDMVVVNLYPFEQTIADPDCTFEQAIEMIDIGGPCLLRAAAKNHRHVLVVTSPADYTTVLGRLRDRGNDSAWADLLRSGGFSAFWNTCGYDGVIAQWLGDRNQDGSPIFRTQRLVSRGVTRYGENPHQRGEILEIAGSVSEFSLAAADAADFDGQTPLSFNNYVDASAALELCADLTRAATFPPTATSSTTSPTTSPQPTVASSSSLWYRLPAGPSKLGHQPPSGPSSLWYRLPAGPSKLEHQPPTGPSSLWYRLPSGPSSLWYRLPAGLSNPAGPGPSEPTQSSEQASGPASSIRGETLSRRYLPHIQSPGRTYFVTFRTRNIKLPPEARDLALSACKYWHKRKMTLHIAVVMPDHVHLLLTPYLYADGSAVSLSELIHSIKSYSANKINRKLNRQGSLWMEERWDRIMRHQREFSETWEYIETNPERAGLGADYRWVWHSTAGFEESGWVEDRLEAGTTSGGVAPEQHRLEAGTTSGATSEGVAGRHDRPEAGTTSEGVAGGHDRLEAGTTSEGVAPEQHRLEAGTTSGTTPPGEAVLAVCCFIKHTNACGTAVAPVVSESPEDVLAARIEAYRRAYLGDPNAAMGGILAVNFPVTTAFAAAVMETYQRWGKPLKEAGKPFAPGAFFIEVWIAPSFDEDAVRIVRGRAEPTPALPNPPKKAWGQRVRLLEVGDMAAAPNPDELDLKRIAGGVLMQTRDLAGLNEEQWRVVTKRAPTPAEMDDLRLAWLVCKHTKSNAITICKDGMLLGSGAGQMSRVMSCRIATWLARDNGHAERLAGAVAASDAFFPFRDGPDILAGAGVTAIIQPGGSKRDQDTIDACDERGVAMVFTGTRHFKH